MSAAHGSGVVLPPRDLAADLPPELGLYQVLCDDGSARLVSEPAILPTLGLRAYRYIKLLRLLDARMILLQRQGRVGFYGACTGQEATPIGTGLAVTEQDWVFPALRESSIMLVRGMPLAPYLCQVFGNRGDILKGRQMPSHMSSRAVKQVSWSSCIATQLPQAVGVAWAARLRGDRDVATVGFIGDGGTSEPDFHNALNFAGVYKVPCVIVCQNNQFAISVRPDRQTASATYAIKGRAYGVPSLRVDGNDVLAMYHAVSQALARARRGEGPTFIEALTYRIGAHSTSDDPSRYRSQDEVDAWAARDPLARLRAHLVYSGLLDDERDELLEHELTAEISAAITEAEAHGPPERASLFDDVYAELPWHLAEQKAELMALPCAPPTHGGGH
ncbi:MAG: 3-methyl-2-oxobutanoate dehydrogenase [Myxococcales bacterium]|nr:3-methyl-2-oxobutanoate dehydrogenase [Myxococcales bacterium]